MTDATNEHHAGWSSPWRRIAFWALAVLGLPATTAAWISIPLTSEEDAEAARAGVSGAPLLFFAIALIALAHLAGWVLLGSVAHGAPGRPRRRTALPAYTVAAVSGIGLAAGLLLTDGQLFVPYPRPYIP